MDGDDDDDDKQCKRQKRSSRKAKTLTHWARTRTHWPRKEFQSHNWQLKFTHACSGYLPVVLLNVAISDGWLDGRTLGRTVRDADAMKRNETKHPNVCSALRSGWAKPFGEWVYFSRQPAMLFLFLLDFCYVLEETGAYVPSRFSLIMRTMHVRE